MDKKTRKKLKDNPHYKPSPDQMLIEEEEVKTFGVLPKVAPSIQKHPTEPNVRLYRKPIDK